MQSAVKTFPDQCLCQSFLLIPQGWVEWDERLQWIKQRGLSHSTKWQSSFIIVTSFCCCFNNENFEVGRDEELVKVHRVVIGRRDVKKEEIVTKSL